MNITVSQQSGCVELKVDGRIDALSVERFQKTVMAEADKGAKLISVDASEVSYISSLGLRALLACHKRMTASGNSFKIGKISSQALQIILMAGMDALVEKH
jgi:anti-anti-sigma factor